MSYNKEITIGLFGFGCVGQGLHQALAHSQGLKASINKICIKDREKKRSLEESLFTFERQDILRNGKNNLVVELIDDADAAFEIARDTISKGKNFVTASKKMVAEKFECLYKLQSEAGTSVLYEGACGGSIPIIRTLEEYYDNEELKSVRGILNGSTNYILTRMEKTGLPFGEALKQAQELGFAESDPFLDVSGTDSKYKLCIIAAHAFGIILTPSNVFASGIEGVSSFDIKYAGERNSKIKLISRIEKSGNGYKTFVIPAFVKPGDSLYNIEYENNGVEVEGIFSGKQLFAGKGAGSLPTGSAVLSDISAITYNYKYGYKKLKKSRGLDNPAPKEKDFLIDVYIRYKNEKELEGLEIKSLKEEYKSDSMKYITANVSFESLKNLDTTGNKEFFICAT